MRFINTHNYIKMFFLICISFDCMLYSYFSDDNDESSEESSDDGVIRKGNSREKVISNSSASSVNKERLKTSSHTYADTPKTSRYFYANNLCYSKS